VQQDGSEQRGSCRFKRKLWKVMEYVLDQLDVTFVQGGCLFQEALHLLFQEEEVRRYLEQLDMVEDDEAFVVMTDDDDEDEEEEEEVELSDPVSPETRRGELPENKEEKPNQQPGVEVGWIDDESCDLHRLASRPGEPRPIEQPGRTRHVRESIREDVELWASLCVIPKEPVPLDTLLPLQNGRNAKRLTRYAAKLMRAEHERTCFHPPNQEIDMVDGHDSRTSVVAAASAAVNAVKWVCRPSFASYHSSVDLLCPSNGVDSSSSSSSSAPSSASQPSSASPLDDGGRPSLCIPPRKRRRVFCNIRPPGHHAFRSHGEGFCIWNNAAIATTYAKKAFPELIKRVLIWDWDLHHGNGTETTFVNDPNVMYVSLHRGGVGGDNIYPGTGLKHRNRHIRNFPIPKNASADFYMDKFREALAEAELFKPDLVVISAGFDSHGDDEFAETALTYSHFTEMTNALCDLADRHAGGRLVSLLEGGYTEEVLAECVRVHLVAMLSA